MLFDKLFNKQNKNINNTNESVSEIANPELFQKTGDAMSLEYALETFIPDFVPNAPSFDKDDIRRIVLCSVALGDISGSKYEGCPYPGLDVQEIFARSQCKEKPVYDGWGEIDLFGPGHRFTDDTVLTLAMYHATHKLVEDYIHDEELIINVYTEYLRHYFNLYPDAGFAAGFEKWALSNTNERNHSYGNGSCMRVSGIPVLCDDINSVIKYAYYSALPSHSHFEGIKGAICTAVIYWMLIRGATKGDILGYIGKHYPITNGQKINSGTTLGDLVDMNKINPWSTLSVVCQTSLVEAVICFAESHSFEECLRNCYKFLCDRDTIAAIAAPMAALYHHDIKVCGESGFDIVKNYLDDKLYDDMFVK